MARYLPSVFGGFFVFFCFALPSSATVIIEPVNTINSSTSFLSVPLHYGHSPDSWTPVSGYLVLGNQTEQFLAAYRLRNPNGTNPPLILVDFYSPPSPPYFEPRLLRWARAYNPVAVAVFGEALERQAAVLGFVEIYRMGYDTNEVTFPMVNTKWDIWYELSPYLINGTEIFVTITDAPKNAWTEIRRGWWPPFFVAVTFVWVAINSSICIFLLMQLPFKRTLGVVVLCIELASNILKIPSMFETFLRTTDVIIPTPIVNVMYSMHWPLHIAAAVIVIFFWMELTDTTNMKASGGLLASHKWVAALAICIVCFVEFGVVAARAANGTIPVVQYITAITYVVILLICAGTYFYLYWQVRQFFASLPRLRSNHNLILRVSVRLLLTGVSFLVLVVAGIVSALPLYFTPVGQSAAQAFLMISLLAGSTLTISAFVESTMKAKHNSSTSGGSGPNVGSSSLSISSNSSASVPEMVA